MARTRAVADPPPVMRDAPLMPTNSLVASAVRYSGKVDWVYQQPASWQQEAWRQYDICSELRFASEWVANAMSRIKLFPATVTPDGEMQKSDDPKVRAVIDDIFGSVDGQAGMLHTFGLHLTVAGECYLVGRTVVQPDGTSKNVWEVIGVNELRVTGNSWTIDYGDGIRPVVLAPDDVVIRIWRPHPVRRMYADSPVRALLPVLTEIEYLTRHVFAQTQSRLAGSGVFFLPQSMKFPPPPDNSGADLNNDADSFMHTLTEAMTKPLSQPGTAASLVPIVVTVPDEALAHIGQGNLVHFWSPFDEKVAQARIDAIKRFAIGMDLPPEVTMGMTSGMRSSGGAGTGASHWTSWQIEEAAIKLHIEPLVELAVNSITMTYVRAATGNPTSAIGFDSSALKLQPDRSKEALSLYDRNEINGEGLREYSGVDDQYAPSEDDTKRWLLTKVAGGSATPDQVGAALDELGVHLDVPPQDTPGQETRQARPAPAIPTNPTPGPPDTGPNGMALIAASEVLVFRALERAGNRLRQAIGKEAAPSCPAAETYRFVKANGSTNSLLRDSWSWAPTVLAGLTPDPDKAVDALNAYTASLLETQAEHDRERMARYLAAAA